MTEYAWIIVEHERLRMRSSPAPDEISTQLIKRTCLWPFVQAYTGDFITTQLHYRSCVTLDDDDCTMLHALCSVDTYVYIEWFEK